MRIQSVAESVFCEGEGMLNTESKGGQSVVRDSVSTSVLERARQGDQDAAVQIDRLYSRLVCYWCWKKGVCPEDTLDISQETFVAVHQYLGSFQRDSQSGGFRAWVKRITHNKINDHFRKQPKDVVVDPSKLEQIESPEDEQEISWERQELFQKAVELIRQEFSQRDFEAFLRNSVDGTTATEIAREIGTTSNALHIAFSRIRYRVREVFGDMIE